MREKKFDGFSYVVALNSSINQSIFQLEQNDQSCAESFFHHITIYCRNCETQIRRCSVCCTDNEAE